MYRSQSVLLHTNGFDCDPALKEAKLSIPSLVLTDAGGSTLTLSNIKINWKGYGKLVSYTDPVTNYVSYKRYATITGTFKTSSGDTINVGTLTPIVILDGNPSCTLAKTRVHS